MNRFIIFAQLKNFIFRNIKLYQIQFFYHDYFQFDSISISNEVLVTLQTTLVKSLEVVTAFCIHGSASMATHIYDIWRSAT